MVDAIKASGNTEGITSVESHDAKGWTVSDPLDAMELELDGSTSPCWSCHFGSLAL